MKAKSFMVTRKNLNAANLYFKRKVVDVDQFVGCIDRVWLKQTNYKIFQAIIPSIFYPLLKLPMTTTLVTLYSSFILSVSTFVSKIHLLNSLSLKKYYVFVELRINFY